MEQKKEKATRFANSGMSMRNIFRSMMEGGYYPTFENSHILFDIDDNIGVVEYEEGILSIRIFFTIEEDAFELFNSASNATMMESFIVKPVILDDMKSIMFSCETMCDTIKEFKKFFPKMIDHLQECISIHKSEMKKLILTQEATASTIQTEDNYDIRRSKILS